MGNRFVNDHSGKISLPQNMLQQYAQDPVAADKDFFGRIAEADRRGFLKGAGLAAMSAMLGAAIPFSRDMPSGLIPIAMAEEALAGMPGKEGMTVLGDKPINIESPAHLLNDDITPTSRHFVRNHGSVPEQVDGAAWTLTIDGEVEKPLTLTIRDLQSQFPVVSELATIECGGNGRAFFNPPARGNQWTVGAVACAKWTGVRLADVIKAAGPKQSALYTAHHGADRDLADPDKPALSRGIPMEKAMEPHTLIAFAMNDGPIPSLNGHPLRLVVPGWVGSASQKWLNRIQLRDVVHDGKGMTGTSYRLPERPLQPGEEAPEALFSRIITAMPVKSLITSPQSGTKVDATSKKVAVRGHAWAGENTVREVVLSIDFGATWFKAHLSEAANKYAWQHWNADITFPSAGYFEIWARATDSMGNA
ncbi:MAG: sulfite oxidase, partial [Magnetococcales bacterium]|nr:sulfite oxidase [Magnetococcales bacterium]